MRDEAGDRTGFQGGATAPRCSGSAAWHDDFDDYLGLPRAAAREARRVLTPDGSLFFHIDYREVHYCKVLLDGIFGRDSLPQRDHLGLRLRRASRRRWPAKHDNILWYAATRRATSSTTTRSTACPTWRPGLVGPEKAARGKTPTDMWWHTIVSPTGKEKTGYPTQKPLGILERIVRVHSDPGDLVLDFFAGSGTTGEAAARNGRGYLLVDANPEAIARHGASGWRGTRPSSSAAQACLP